MDEHAPAEAQEPTQTDPTEVPAASGVAEAATSPADPSADLQEAPTQTPAESSTPAPPIEPLPFSTAPVAEPHAEPQPEHTPAASPPEDEPDASPAPFTPDPKYLCASCVNLDGGACYQLRVIQSALHLSADTDPKLTSCGRYIPITPLAGPADAAIQEN